MIEGRTVLAIVPARGGSKAVPRKNIRLVANKPLIVWTIEEAKKSRYVDRLIVSTDDNEIASVATQCGCEVPFMRPAELALDDSPGILTVLHAIETLPVRYDLVALLQPTSPLRSAEDIDGCINYLISKNAPACVSIVRSHCSPYWMFKLDSADGLSALFENNYDRRQDLPDTFSLNGAVYVADTRWVLNTQSFLSKHTIGYVMPKERSFDIDDEVDLLMCSLVLSNRSAR